MAGQSGKGTSRRSPAAAKGRQDRPAASFKNEVILWAVLAFSLVLFISNFGVAGKAGGFLSDIFFGLFGFITYILPIVLFAGTAFLIANQDNPVATIKVTASVVFLLFICMFLELTGGNSLAKSPIDSFLWSQDHKYGGGLTGGLLTWLIRKNLGTVCAYVIDIIMLIICLVLITERSLWKHIASGSKKMYRTAKKESVRQHQQYVERKQRRIDNKVVGVSTDTSIKENVRPGVSDAVNELHPDPVFMQDFPIHRMGQEERSDNGRQLAPEPVAERMDKIQDEGQEDILGDLDNIIPITKQKVVLQPSMPKDTEDAGEQDGLLAKTSDLFSDMLPDMEISADISMDTDPEAASIEEDRYGYQTDVPDLEELGQAGQPDLMEDSFGSEIPVLEENDPAEKSPVDDMQEWDGMDDIGEIADLEEIEDFGTAVVTSAEDLIAQQLQNSAVPVKASPQRNAAAPSKASSQPISTARPKQSQAEIASDVTEIGVQMQQVQMPVKKEYVYPPSRLLKIPDPNQTGDSRQHLQETALKLQQTLKNFGVNVTILNVSCGPSVTRYEIQPEMGVKVSKIVNLADDIKLNLAAADIRIEAPIPGKAAIGIEVPNKENVPVMFRELIEAEEFKQHKSHCTFAVGKDIAGKVVVTDICKMPHLLIAGATGSGKSVCINTIIMSIIYKADPEDVKLIMIDPKVVELSVYNGIPHLLLPVVTDPKKAAGALHWAVSEMMERYQKFAACGVRDIKGYNAKIKKLEQVADENKPQKMTYIVIIVDELADLMMVAPGDVEDAICRLAQLARAAGIHLIIATQRPSVNVITGLIKANMPSRIAFSVTSGIDSRTILDMNGAEKLLGKGDMLFYPQGYQKPVRVQGAFVSDQEVTQVVEFLTEQNGASQYSRAIEEQVANASSGSGTVSMDSGPEDDRDVYFTDAAKLLIDKEKASVSMLQRYFKIGFNRAARIMDQLEEAGVVGPEEGTKPRKILMGPEEFAQYEEEVL